MPDLSHLTSTLASISLDRLRRLSPRERTALLQACQRIVRLAEQGVVADGPARRIERIEVEDHPDY